MATSFFEPSTTDVRNLMRAASSFELDQGEAETLVVASQLTGPTTLVIDEGEATIFVKNVLIGRGATSDWQLVCLGDVLHKLEANDAIDSASTWMQRLLDGNHYHWAPAVRTDYERRCVSLGRAPLPRTKSHTD